MREDLLKDWGDILERWVGKEKTRPTKVVKLCRKVSVCEVLFMDYGIGVLFVDTNFARAKIQYLQDIFVSKYYKWCFSVFWMLF